MQKKQQIRAVLKEKRDHLSQEQIITYSERICEKILNYILAKNPEMVFFYYPLGKEVNLLPLADKLLTSGKKIAFPRTSGEDMDFYQSTSLSDFQKGAFGIMEPIGETMLEEPEAMILVPGLGFDKKGNRIGYGKGFYDRYFTRFPDTQKLGIAYEVQILEELPADEYDIPMDRIVTERDRR